MSFIEVKPTNANAFEKDLKRFGAKAEVVYSKAVTEASQQYRDFVKRMPAVSAPRDGYRKRGMPVDTGNLRRAIRARKISKLAAGVGIGLPARKYGRSVHEGMTTRSGSKVPGRPFLQWALRMGAMRKIDQVFRRHAKLLP